MYVFMCVYLSNIYPKYLLIFVFIRQPVPLPPIPNVFFKDIFV